MILKNKKSKWEILKEYKQLIYLSLLIILILLIFFVKLWPFNLIKCTINKLISKYFRFINKLYENNKFECLIVIFISTFIYFLINIPSYTFFITMYTIIINNWIESFFIILGFGIINGLLIRFISKNYLKNIIEPYIKQYDTYIIILKESLENPWKAMFFIRLSAMPSCLKEYLSAFTIKNEYINNFGSFISNLINAINAILISLSFHSYRDFIETKSKKKSTMLIVVTSILVVFDLSVFIIIGIFLNKKLKEKRSLESKRILENFEVVVL